MEDTAESLRAELERTRGTHRGVGYPPDVRARAGAWLARRQRTTGETWSTLGARLGIDRSTAQTWAGQTEHAAGDASVEHAGRDAFLAVCVEDRPAEAGPSGAVLITPSGYRVEGLTERALVAVLRGLE